MNRIVGEEESASDNQRQELVDQFVEITSVDRERARFYLDTAGFDLALALSGFYEGGFDEEVLIDEQPEILNERIDDTDDDEVQIIEEPDDDGGELVVNSSRKQRATNTNRSGEMSGRSGEDKKKGDEKKKGEEKKKGIATLFGGPGGRESGTSDDDDDERGQAFYVGGSEKSGQQVLGPPKKKEEAIVDRFFKQAKERGAEQIDANQRGAAAAAAAGSSSSGSVFGGAGYRLGDSVKPAEKVGGDRSVSVEMVDEEPATVTVILRMWRNGFNVDDEPLRTYDDAANRQFMQHIMDGRIPPELVQAHRGKRIDLEMEDHRNEDYKAPKKVLKAFSGQGHALGSPVPDVVGAAKVGEKSSSSAAASAANGAVAESAASIPVDETKPVTNIQVRLGNGERLVMKLNNQHTIKDLREFICRMRPDLAARTFILMTNFPNKELTDDSATLEESNLLNAVIIQRFK